MGGLCQSGNPCSRGFLMTCPVLALYFQGSPSGRLAGVVILSAVFPHWITPFATLKSAWVIRFTFPGRHRGAPRWTSYSQSPNCALLQIFLLLKSAGLWIVCSQNAVWAHLLSSLVSSSQPSWEPTCFIHGCQWGQWAGLKRFWEQWLKILVLSQVWSLIPGLGIQR